MKARKVYSARVWSVSRAHPVGVTLPSYRVTQVRAEVTTPEGKGWEACVIDPRGEAPTVHVATRLDGQDITARTVKRHDDILEAVLYALHEHDMDAAREAAPVSGTVADAATAPSTRPVAYRLGTAHTRAEVRGLTPEGLRARLDDTRAELARQINWGMTGRYTAALASDLGIVRAELARRGIPAASCAAARREAREHLAALRGELRALDTPELLRALAEDRAWLNKRRGADPDCDSWLTRSLARGAAMIRAEVARRG